MRWLPSASSLIAAIVMVVSGDFSGPSIVVGILLLFLAVGVSPWMFPRTRTVAAAEQVSATQGSPIIYWRPGCSFCLRLRWLLGFAGNRAIWVDVSLDEEAAARVRAVNDGNETVPTVFVGGTAHTNPPVHWVREHLTDD